MLDLPPPALRAELAETAAEVALAAARLVVDGRPGGLGVWSTKSSRTDIVTVMDQRSQDLLLDLLRAARPDDAVHGEEQGSRTGSSGITWVVDPIDGTVNYLYEIPAYAVSVAAVVGDPAMPGAWRPVAGAVVDPTGGEVFVAHLGGGAVRRAAVGAERAASTGSASDLGLALVGTGFGYAADLRARQARALVEVLPSVRDIRRFGSAALDLCHVAVGRLDGYYETGLNAWDLAAGWLVATEAGAVVGGPGGALDPSPELTWACAPGLVPEFPDLVQRVTGRHVTTRR